MKTKTTRGLAALLLSTATMSVAACGGNDEKTTSGSTPASSTAATTANAVDRAFVSQMIPHHQLAVRMAAAAQKQATHTDTKTLANAIVTAQNREIEELRAEAKAIGVMPAAMSSGGTTHGADHAMTDAAKALGLSEDEMGMTMDMQGLMDAKRFDRAFIDSMLPHHKGAIAMARAELAHGRDAKLRRIATAIVAAQQREMKHMSTWRTRWYGTAPMMTGSGM